MSSSDLSSPIPSCQVASVMSDSVRPHRLQPTRLLCPWDSPGKNTGVGCHFLLQCIKVKSEVKSLSRAQLFATPWTTAYQAPPSMGFSRQEYWNGMPLPSPNFTLSYAKFYYLFTFSSEIILLCVTCYQSAAFHFILEKIPYYFL